MQRCAQSIFRLHNAHNISETTLSRRLNTVVTHLFRRQKEWKYLNTVNSKDNFRPPPHACMLYASANKGIVVSDAKFDHGIYLGIHGM